jgi:conjugative transfer region protein TrbK
MRGHFLNYRAVGRLLLFVSIAIAVILAAAWLIRHSQVGSHVPVPPAMMSSRAIEQELDRCQAIGTVAQTDQSCIAAWAENRRRFFGSAP